MAKDDNRFFSPLTKKVLHVQQYHQGYEELVSEIMLYIYQFFITKKHWTHDDAANFLLYYAPRIRNLVSRFTYTDRSFECLLFKSIHLQAISYRKKCSEHDRKQSAASYHYAKEYEKELRGYSETVRETAISYLDSRRPGRKRPNPAEHIRARRILIAALCNALVFPEKLYPTLAEAAKLPLDTIYQLFQRVRTLEKNKIEKIEKMEQKRDSCFAHIIILESILHRSMENHDRQMRLYADLIRTRQRLHELQKKLKTCRRAAAHKHVAQVLGIPKGTVDSAMFYMIRQFQDKQDKNVDDFP